MNGKLTYERIRATPSQRRLAAARLAAYCRCLGLNDEAAVYRTVGRLLERGAEVAGQSPDLDRRVVAEAMREVELWMETVARLVGRPPLPLPDGLFAWRLRRALVRCPKAFLEQRVGQLPESFVRALDGLEPPVVPTAGAGRMLPQPLGKLPALLRRETWQRLGRSLGLRRRATARRSKRP